jgi:hypothetical protein
MSKHFERPDRQVFSPAAAAIIFNKVVSLHGQQNKSLEDKHDTSFNGVLTVLDTTGKTGSADTLETLFVGSKI